MTETTAPHPSTIYQYVEVADGSVNHRGKVKLIEQVDGYGKVEQYTTYGRATIELLAWLQTHKNKDGRQTTARFDGAIWTPFLHLDFDAEGDVEKALAWARLTQKRLGAMGVDSNALRWFYSGCKGFHCEIPEALFGGFTPGTELHRQLKAAAKLILQDIPFDPTVYNKLRLWRVENSINAKGKRFKIRLTPEELMTLDLGAIQALALAPRQYPRVDADTDDWLAVPDLADIRRQAEEEAGKPATSGPAAAVGDDDRDRLTIVAIGAAWPRTDEQGARPVRHDYLLAVGGYLARRTSADHVGRLLKAGADASGDHDRDWSEEIDRIAADSAAKVAADTPVVGLPRLAEQFAGLAKVLGVLWEEPVTELDVGPTGTTAVVRPVMPMGRSARARRAAITSAFTLRGTGSPTAGYTPPTFRTTDPPSESRVTPIRAPGPAPDLFEGSLTLAAPIEAPVPQSTTDVPHCGFCGQPSPRSRTPCDACVIAENRPAFVPPIGPRPCLECSAVIAESRSASDYCSADCALAPITAQESSR